jgi:uncharacterized protein (TIGR02996 family)
LLKAIVDDPESDSPRLAFAAACEPGDPARAELIRFQCEYARLDRRAPERPERYERLKTLLQTHGARWIGSASPVVQISSFWRGFVFWVRASPSELLSHAAALLDLAPSLDLYLEEGEPGAPLPDALLGHPLFARVRHLELAEAEDEEQGGRLRTLLEAPALQALRSLTLRDGDCNPAAARVIAESLPPSVRALSLIGFMSTSFDDASMSVLASSPRLEGLHHLILYNCNLRGPGARHLARSPHLARLKTLRLGLGQYTLNQVGAGGASDLATAPFCPSLEDLDLDFNNIGDAGLRALAIAPFGALRCLRLQANEIGDAAALALVRSPLLQQLEVLDLSHNRLGPKFVRALAEARPDRLRVLWLYGNPIELRGLAELARAPWLSQLEELNLDQVGLRERDVKDVLKLEALRAAGRVSLVSQKGLDKRVQQKLSAWLGASGWRAPITNLRASDR